MSNSDFEFPKGRSVQKRSSPPPAHKPSSKPVLEQEDPTSTLSEKDLQTPDKNPDSQVPEYSEEELLRVFDEILFSNEYTETILIRGRMEVTFRTRTAKEVQEIDKALDSLGASLVSTVENMRSFLHLEKALVSYNGKDISTMRNEEKSNFVKSLPGPIIGTLMVALGKFDIKVGMACKAGEENF